MLYFSIGYSGPIADWCDLAVSRLSTLQGGQAAQWEGGEVGPLESASIALVRSGADNLAFAIRRPNRELLAMLSNIHAPFLLALDDPRHTVPEDEVSAIRARANVCPFLMEFVNLPNALCIRVTATSEPLATLTKIARHFHMRVPPADIERLASTMPAVRPDICIPNEVVRGALGAYAQFFESGHLGDFVWQSALFMRATDPSRPLSEPVRFRDTFNGRYLIYGPYLALPPGHWNAELLMAISPEGGGQTLTIDVFNGKVLSTVRCISRPGDFRTPPLQFVLDSIEATPLEVRVLIEREGAPGELLFRHAVLRRRTGTSIGSP